MKLKLAGIALKRPQNSMDTKVTHRRVEVSRFHSISFPYFELLYMIVTFPYKLLYLHCYAVSCNNVHGPQGAWDTCVLLYVNSLDVLWIDFDFWFSCVFRYLSEGGTLYIEEDGQHFRVAFGTEAG